ncbi:hypothetical protein ACP4OV_011124 [Aristida adscensionis]
MADIALLVVEEFERGAKRAAMLRRRSPQPAAAALDAGDRPASCMRRKQSAYAAAAAAVSAGTEPTGKLGCAAADGFFSA